MQLLRAQEQLQQAASVVSGSIGSYNTASESGDLAAACVALAALAPCLGYSAVEVGSVELDLRNSFGGNSLLGEGSLIDLGAKWGEVAISPRTILSGETEAEISAAERAIEKEEDGDDVSSLVTTVAGFAESPSPPPITTSSNQQSSSSSELNNPSSARVNETPKKKALSTLSSAGGVDSQQGASQPSSSSIPTPTLLDLVPLSSRLRVRIGGASLGLSEHAAPFFAKFVSDVALTAVEEWTDAVREISAERIKRRQIMHSAQQQALRKQQQQQQLLQQQLGSTTSSQRFDFNEDFTGGISGGIGLPRFQQQALFTSSLQSSLNNNRPSSNSPFVPHVQQPWGSGRRDDIGSSSIFSSAPSSSTTSLREMNDNDGQRFTSGETSVGAVVLVDGKERGVSQELSNMVWGRLDIIVEKTLYLRLITDSTAVEASVSGVRLSLEQAPLLFEGSSTLEVLEDKGEGNIVIAGGDNRGGAEPLLLNSNVAFPENVDNQVYDRVVNEKTNRGAIVRGGGGGVSSSSSSARWAAAFSGPRSSGGISAGDLEMVHRTLSLSLTSATVAKIAFDASSSSSSSSSSLVSNTVKQLASSSAAMGGTSRSSSSSLNRGGQGLSSAAPQQSSWPSRGVVSSSSLSSSSSSSSSSSPSSLLSDVPASGSNARNSLPIVSLPPFELELDTEQWVDVSDYVISLEERVFYLLNSSFLPRLSPTSSTASSSSGSVSSASAILSAGGSGSITNAAVSSSSSSSSGPATGSKSIEIAFNPKEFEPLTGQRGVLKAFAASFVEAQKAFKSDATQVYQLLEAAEQAAQALYQQQRSIEVGAGGGGGGVNPQFHPHRSHPHGNRGEPSRSSGPSSQSIVSLVFEPNESKAADLGRSSCLVFAPTFVNLFGTTISDWDFLLRRITGIASADQGIKMIPRHLHESVTLPLAMLLGLSRDVTIIATPLLLSCANAAVHIPFPLPPTLPDTVCLLTGNNQQQQQEGKSVTSIQKKL